MGCATSCLLDVNILIALIDPNRVGHDVAQNWFQATGRRAWSTCPITENGVIRIVSHARYPETPGALSVVAGLLAAMCALPGHQFWPDDVSLVSGGHVQPAQLMTSAQVTDAYLLALAVARSGQLATMDRKLVTRAVYGERSALHVIGAG